MNNKKCVFVQKTYEKIYSLQSEWYMSRHGDKNQITKSVYTKNKENLIEEKEVLAINTLIPILMIGEKFYIDEIKETVVIIGKYITSKGNIRYEIEPKLIETKNTTISKDKCDTGIFRFDTINEENILLAKELKKYKDAVDGFNKSHFFSQVIID